MVNGKQAGRDLPTGKAGKEACPLEESKEEQKSEKVAVSYFLLQTKRPLS